MAIAPAKIGRRLIKFSLEKLSHIAIADKGINMWNIDCNWLSILVQLLVGGGVNVERQCTLWGVRSLTLRCFL